MSPHVKNPISGVLWPPGCDRSPARCDIFSSSEGKYFADCREGNNKGENEILNSRFLWLLENWPLVLKQTDGTRRRKIKT